jgi:hypothetical protein
MNVGRDAASPRLKRLGPSDFTKSGATYIFGDRGVVGHILWFEGPDPQTPDCCGTAQPGY